MDPPKTRAQRRAEDQIDEIVDHYPGRVWRMPTRFAPEQRTRGGRLGQTQLVPRPETFAVFGQRKPSMARTQESTCSRATRDSEDKARRRFAADKRGER
jgi:hypothetical protein